MISSRNWLSLILVPAGAAALIGLGFLTGNPVRDRVGNWHVDADAPAAAALPFNPSDQAEVLLSGLDNPRGVACRARTIYVAENDGSIVRYPSPPPRTSGFDARQADVRGIAFDADGSLLLADFGRAAIMKRPSPPGDSKEIHIPVEGLTGPVGVAAVDGTLFLTDASAALLIGESQLDNSMTVLKDLRLRHPSGVAAASRNGPVYVAEADDREVRWPVIDHKGDKWMQIRALGTVPIEGRTISSFLGIAISPDNGYIFAAGPRGLYVFRRDANREVMLGWMEFDEPVSGVAACGRFVYLTVGHRLCHILLTSRS